METSSSDHRLKITCPHCRQTEGYPSYVCTQCRRTVRGRTYTALPRIKESLLSPAVLRRIRQERANGLVGLPSRESLDLEWTEDARDRLLRWCETATLQNLAHLLRKDPWALFHPIVYQQLQYLTNVGAADCEEMEVGATPSPTKEAVQIPEENIFLIPKPARRAELGLPERIVRAERELARLGQAWLQGLLPGYQIRVGQPRGRGRPQKIVMAEMLRIAVSCRTLHRELQTWSSLQRQTHESDEEHRARLCAGAQRLWTKHEPFQVVYRRWVLYCKSEEPAPLALKDAQAIVAMAVSLNRNVKESLVLCLLAFRAKKSPGQIEGIIKRTKKRFPQLRLSRRQSRRDPLDI